MKCDITIHLTGEEWTLIREKAGDVYCSGWEQVEREGGFPSFLIPNYDGESCEGPLWYCGLNRDLKMTRGIVTVFVDGVKILVIGS